MSLSNEREPTAGERLRDAFTPEAREERRRQGEEERRRRSAEIERGMSKNHDKEDRR